LNGATFLAKPEEFGKHLRSINYTCIPRLPGYSKFFDDLYKELSLARQRGTMTLRRCLFIFGIFGASVVALAVLGAATVLLELSYRPTYDQSHPDYHRYAETFDRLSVPISTRGITNEDAIDLSELNAGEWKIVCVFGGYTKPLETMRALGANINEKDQLRLTEAGSRGFRLAQVEESEMAIAYVDLNNNAQFIHFENGIGPEGQHFQKCIARPETRLLLAMP
jgi:hypothetical protein